MRERARTAGGRLRVLSRPGEGTTVRLEAPAGEGDAASVGEGDAGLVGEGGTVAAGVGDAVVGG